MGTSALGHQRLEITNLSLKRQKRWNNMRLVVTDVEEKYVFALEVLFKSTITPK